MSGGWETYEGNANGGGNYEEREKVKVGIGLKLTGVVVRQSGIKPSKFGGDVRYVDVDTEDGRKVAIAVSGILLERWQEARPADGDMIRIVVESAVSQSGPRKGDTYGKPTLAVKRGDGRQAEAAEMPSEPPEDPWAKADPNPEQKKTGAHAGPDLLDDPPF